MKLGKNDIPHYDREEQKAGRTRKIAERSRKHNMKIAHKKRKFSSRRKSRA